MTGNEMRRFHSYQMSDEEMHQPTMSSQEIKENTHTCWLENLNIETTVNWFSSLGVTISTELVDSYFNEFMTNESVTTKSDWDEPIEEDEYENSNLSDYDYCGDDYD